MFKFLKVYRSATPSAGSVAWNTPNVHGRLTRVNVKPTTGTTQWHMKITDSAGFAVWESDTLETGEVNDGGIAGFLSQVRGILTVTITGATVDEVFSVQLDIEQYSVT